MKKLMMRKGDVTLFTKAKTIKTEVFERIRDNSHRLVVYPYSYLEYKDFKGKRHNALFMEYLVLNIDSLNGYARSITDRAGIELWRWDVDTDRLH